MHHTLSNLQVFVMNRTVRSVGFVLQVVTFFLHWSSIVAPVDTRGRRYHQLSYSRYHQYSRQHSPAQLILSYIHAYCRASTLREGRAPFPSRL